MVYDSHYSLRQAGLTFEKMFDEVPIVIKNSHLLNVLLCELQEKQQPNKQYPVLDLATRYNYWALM